MRTGKIEQFKSLSQFKSLKDFNNNIEQWMVDYKSEFTKSELIAFNRLKRYAAKVYGVSNVSINKLSAISKELDQGGISRSTFKRMLKKAKHFGIITVYDTERTDGSTSTNIYVFNCYSIEPCQKEQEVLQTAVQEDLIENQLNHHKTENKSKTNNKLDIRKDNAIKDIPFEYQDLLKDYGYSPKQIVEFYKCVKYATKYLTYYTDQDKVKLGLRALKQMIINKKLGYKVRNMFGYYTQILHNFLDVDYLQMVRNVTLD
ncbi:hypothetical protein A2U94_17845 [Bacillus sp. VT 712]|uniref:hypothetical protein n=1 Tax=Bacillaceae TaxID=186817 RepID=UPI000473BC80|nr:MULTISPECIES: hypothetical protein [Bacillaceae]KZB90117.1 hypothetical protein A2U94_17845 [Bacillus sp. VT 712]